MAKKFSLNEIYNYFDRLNLWRKFATKNAVITSCEKCHKTHAHKSVLLETGEHACWYCWISKGNNLGRVTAKPSAKPMLRLTAKPQPRIQLTYDKKETLPSVSSSESKNALVLIKKHKKPTRALTIKKLETRDVSEGEFPCPEHKQSTLNLLPKQKLRKLLNYRRLMWMWNKNRR